jgi:lipopolysaccharide transport system permease protein
MLLGLRRRLGFASADAGDYAAEESQRSSEKWVIEPTRIGYFARFEELWRYRRIVWFFSTQAIKDRYARTTLGKFWLFARPLGPILISTLIFGRLLNVPSSGVPYLLFFIAGSSSWRVFDRSMLWVTKSLEGNRSLIKKVYFPRLAAPMSAVAPAITEFLILLGLLVAACLIYYFKDGIFYLRIGPQMLVGVVAVILTIVYAISVGLWTSVMQVRHKDVQYGIRYALQFWLYLTPVIYPLSAVPERYRYILYLNPMASLVETYKWGMLGIDEFPAAAFLCGLVVIALTFAGGLVYFDRSEAGSVDRL